MHLTFQIFPCNKECNFAKIKTDSYKKYWVNCSQGRIFVGAGDFGENLFFYHSCYTF